MTTQSVGLGSTASCASPLTSFQGSVSHHSSIRRTTALRKLPWGRTALAFAWTLLLAGVVSAYAQAPFLLPNWTQLSSGPEQRYFPGMAYDAGHSQAVLFGGTDGATFLNDTWLWNGTAWAPATPSASPSPRSAFAMTYDAAHSQVVLFGGRPAASGADNDTWLWNGTTWTQATPGTVPPARSNNAMVYDAARGNVVMFGGLVGGLGANDTWIWSGSNWIQLFPSVSPSPRSSYSMAYDAVHQQVVLFGGFDQFGNNLNDTWVWNGTNWAQMSPATSPTPRFGQGMAWDAALSQVVLFGGTDGSTYFGDTWSWDGTNWIQRTGSSSPAQREAFGMVYEAAQSQILLFGGFNGTFFPDTWEWSTPQNFGNVSVCTPGPSFATACSTTVVLTYNVPAATTFGATQVLMQGAAAPDFSLVNSGCTGSIPAGKLCNVTISFAPQAPGLRTAAVELLDISGNPLVTTPIYGTGLAPEIAFGPAATNSASGLETVVPTGTAPLSNPQGIATDEAGNLYIANAGASTVLKVTNGTASVVGSGFASPRALAIDGAGDLFVADPGLHEVVEIPAGCAASACQSVVYNVASNSGPVGVAVDALGDLFVVSPFANGVLEIPAGCTSTACQIPVGSGWVQPVGVALDAAGDVFVVDSQLEQVIKVPAGCTSTGCQTAVGSGWIVPKSVAVDVAGDVVVTDTGINFGSGGVVEVPAGCATSACQIPLLTATSFGVATNAAGEIFVSEQIPAVQILQINQSQPPALAFAATQFGSTSSDSPQSMTILNVGNQPLAGSGLTVPSGFVQANLNGNPPDCTGTFSLSPGQGCNLSINFQPAIGEPYSAQANIQDNSLNGDFATQAINLSGTGLGTETVTVIGAGAGNGAVISNPTGINCNILGGVASGTCSAIFPGGVTVSFEEIPSSGSTFVTWGNACASFAASQFCNITLNSSPTVSASFAPTLSNATLSVTEVGLGSGAVTSSPTGISCSEISGAISGTCSSDYPIGSGIILTAAPKAGSTFVGWSGACAGAGTSLTCKVTLNQAATAIADFVQQNFGNVNVCPSGQSTPAPCSQTVALTYNMGATTTIGAIQVVTQGVTGLDFSLASGSTCTGKIAANTSCNVNVTFAPLAPGSRLGAVKLFDSNGNLIENTLVYGIGQAPAAAFNPSAPVPVNTGSFALDYPAGLLTDAAGNLFIANGDLSNQVLQIAPNGTISTVGFGMALPQGMAEDGAGDLFIANNNLNLVVEIPAGCISSACQINLAGNLRSQLGVAVDGAGDLFVGDFLDGEVAEIPAGCTSTACQQIIYSHTPAVASTPVGLTADAAGDVFFADEAQAKVIEIPAGCTVASCLKTIGVGWAQPDGVAVDAAGNVYVADQKLQQVVEVPLNCTTSACQIVLASGIRAVAVALDGEGNLFTDNITTNQVLKINRTQPPSLNFALTNVGATSTDSPQPITLQNIGNQTLTESLSLRNSVHFLQTGSCDGTVQLTPGGVCSEAFSFAPQNTGYLTTTENFADNTFNLSQSVSMQPFTLAGTSGLNGQAVAAVVPNVVGMTQSAATQAITTAGLTLGAVTSGYSSSEPAGTIFGESPAAGTTVNPGSAVAIRISIGEAPPPTPNPLTLESNTFVTGDFATAGVTLHGTGVNGKATATINIPVSSGPASAGVPTGADIVDGLLYWETLENTPAPSGNTGTFLGYAITGQQVGKDLPYTDGAFTGTLRVYRADVNAFFQDAANGIRIGSGAFPISLPDGTGTQSGFPIQEGANLVVLYRVLSPNFPLKAVVIYDGSTLPAVSTNQNVQGFYDAVGPNGPSQLATLSYANGAWSGSSTTVFPGFDASSYTVSLNPGSAYAAVIFSTPVRNSDNDGILDAWKTGPPPGDFFAGQPGYYDVKTSSWVPLPGAKHGEKDLFVQLDYMCGAVLANGTCDPTKENLFPSPDSSGNDPLAMVQKAFTQSGIALHLEIGNAVPEDTCTDGNGQLCQFPNEPGVVGWKNSLEFSKIWPRNLTSCAGGGDCTARFPYGQKDSYHYVLFGHSLAIPAWNSRYGSLTSIQVANNVTTLSTGDRGTGINACPMRITIAGVLSRPELNGVYNTQSCPDSKTIIVSTPGVPNWTWSYATNTPPEPAIGITFGQVTSISGYSDLGGADSAVTLGLWETSGQDQSKRANVIAGTLFHEIGHTLGLSHGGLYYDGPAGNYIPTFEANCKPNYQSDMNYLFQLDGVGPNAAVAFSNQTLNTLTQSSLGTVTQLTDTGNAPATFPTSAWYVPFNAGTTTASPATLHCDGTPLNGDSSYRVDGPIAPITPAWSNGQNITFDGVPYTTLRGYNDVANLDLRQLGATGGEFASLASVISFDSSATQESIQAGGNVTLGSGGTVTLGSGGNVTLGSGGNVTLGSGGTITPGSGGTVAINNGGTVTMSTGGVITLGSGGNVTLGSGGNVTLGSGGVITLGSGGNITLGSGGVITLGSGGTITSSLGTVTIPSTGGTYTLPDGGGVITLGSGGNITLGSGGNVTLGSGGTITLGSGGNVTLGSGGTVTLGSGGVIALGSGGNVTLGSGGNVTLGSGGVVTLGSGGNITLGSGGNVTLGSGGVVTLGSGGVIALGSGGNVTLGSGGTVTLGSGGSLTLNSGGVVTLGSGGTITGLGSVPAGTYNVSAGGVVTLGSGGTVTLGSGGNVTLGSGGNVTLGSGGVIALGSGGNVTLGSGGNVTLGSGGATTNELDFSTANSIVRPPTSPTETTSIIGNVINWNPPAFGVVQTYTVYRSVNGGPAIAIGSVSGLNGNPPATTFTDTNPPVGTLVYTITTTLVPDTQNSTPRQSPQSTPAVVTYNQTIVLSPLPSSVPLSTGSISVSATVTSGAPAGSTLPPVTFSAAGPCSVGNQSTTNAVTTATVNFVNPGSCTITASQAGGTIGNPPTTYNAADPVSGTFTILAPGSNTTAQTINFSQLPNVQYGSTFTPSATASSGETVTFTAQGPCTPSGATTGVGLCTITASAPGGAGQNNTTYSPASVSQSFTVFPAVITVTATSFTISYGQALPSLTYTLSGFVNNDQPSVVSGAPALSTTATATSNAGSYPIMVATGSLAAKNYSFFFVPGTLTIQLASQTITFITNPPASAAFNTKFTVAATGGGSGNPVTFTSSGACTNSGATYTMTSGTGTCSVIANQAGNINYAAAPQVTKTVTATPGTLTSGTNCNGIYTGTFSGNIIVSPGQSCTFVNGHITGSVQQKGGSLSLTGTLVSGSVQITGASLFFIGPSSTVAGSLQITSITAAAAQNQVCGATITQSVIVQSSGTALLIGSQSSCAPNQIGASLQVSTSSGSTTMIGNTVAEGLQVSSNSGPTVIDANQVGSSLQDTGNTGATQVFSNIIKQSLQCSNNTSITGGNNTAQKKQGQCANF